MDEKPDIVRLAKVGGKKDFSTHAPKTVAHAAKPPSGKSSEESVAGVSFFNSLLGVEVSTSKDGTLFGKPNILDIGGQSATVKGMGLLMRRRGEFVISTTSVDDSVNYRWH